MTTLADEIAALLLKALACPDPAPELVKPTRRTRKPRKGAT